MSDNIYEIREILKKKTINGIDYFLISWKGYGPEENTWEPRSNIHSQEIIKEFEKSKPRKRMGLDRGLPLKNILSIGKSETDGSLMFLVEWQDCTETDLVPAKQLNLAYPQMVIEFYQSKLGWTV